MADDLNAKGTVEIEFALRDIDSAISRLGRFNEETGHTVKAATQAERSAVKAASALRGQGDAAQTSAQKTAQAAREARNLESAMIRQRYALYDVATTYGIISAAALAASGYAIKVAADFESAFTAVERTSNASPTGLIELRDQLVDLSTQIPLTFAELSKIATLGNQLGIPEDQIESFTQTVARFATVTGISVEAAATAFGSLGELLNLAPGDYERLGSAIAYVGRNSVATEAEIISLTTRIAASATRAGYTTQEVVALAGALASLRVAPERAQGVLEVYFNRLNTALANGGERLETFAAVAGMTIEEVQNLARTDPNRFFRQFAAGLASLDSVSQTQALEALGLSGIRAGEVFGRFAGNLGVFDKALADANKSFAEGSELSDQYAKVVDDLNSQFTMLINAVNALIATASGGLVPTLAEAIGHITEMVNGLREFASTPVGQFLGAFVVGLTTIIGLIIAYKAATALATASTYALTIATSSLGASRVGIGGLIAAILGVGTAAGASTSKVAVLKAGIAGLAKATGLLFLLDLIYKVIFAWDELEQEVNDFTGADKAFEGINSQMYEFMGTTVGVQNGVLRIGDAAVSAADVIIGAFAPVIFLLNLVSGGFNMKRAKADAGVGKSMKEAAVATREFDEALDGIGGGGGGGSAGAAARQIRTLVDYANDLSQVFKRAFDIRFGGQQGLDKITSDWYAIANATREANERIREHLATMQQLTADKSVKEYWLSVAENYGDALRAGELRAELAQIDSDLVKTSAALTAEQDKNNKSLLGNSEGAIANRAAILGLVTDYQSYVQALAASGISQTELATQTAALKQDFINQATQLGYNTDELAQYTKGFDDVTFAINNVPREITVDANMDPAIQALNEYLAQVNASSASPSIGGGGGAAGALDGDSYANEFDRAFRARAKSIGARGKMPIYVNPFDFWGFDPSGYGFASGGYTGDGGKYQPAGIVHAGEFVFSKKATKALGVQRLAYMHNMAKSGRGYASGGQVGGGGSSLMPTGYAQLSPTDRQLLMDIRDAIDRKPVPGAKTLSNAIGAANANSASRRDA